LYQLWEFDHDTSPYTLPVSLILAAPFMIQGYVHNIDPVLADIAGVHLWWYGLGFALGFLEIHLYLLRHRARLGISRRETWVLSTLIGIGVLLGGRAVEVAFDEWPFYREHPGFIPALWLGGMATHGLLIGGFVAVALFAVIWKKPLLALADTLAVPAALLMAMGRIGNFIDGQIVGYVTNVWWAVQFPYAEGFRHPVVLYDGAKNLLLMLFLLHVRKTNSTPGAVAARFVFWYAFPRIFIDLFRDYPTHRLALGTGQTLNLVMAAIGVVLLVRSRLRRLGKLKSVARAPVALAPQNDVAPQWWQRIAFACLLAFCLTIASNWTQDIPVRYGKRHAGLVHSRMYPAIDWTPPAATPAPR
jgi:phosphatidylglycerol:prolipoprotein diacylglycerol transferase